MQARTKSGPEIFIAGKFRDAARGSTGNIDGISMRILWLAIGSGVRGDGDALAVCVSDDCDGASEPWELGLDEGMGTSLGLGDSLTVDVSVGAESVGAVASSSIGGELFSSASTGATMVSKIPVMIRAPIRFAKTEGLWTNRCERLGFPAVKRGLLAHLFLFTV